MITPVDNSSIPFGANEGKRMLSDYNSCLGFRFAVPPLIHVPNQLLGAPLGTDVVLECFVQASPKSINYWVMDDGKIPLGHLTI